MTTQLEAIQHHNKTVNGEFALLTSGVEIAGHRVIACTKMHERVVGDCYATWVALCVPLDNNAHWHNWVVWNVVARESGFIVQNGTYSQSWTEIIEAFHSRGGQLSL